MILDIKRKKKEKRIQLLGGMIGICTISFFKREGAAIGWGKKASPSSHFTRGRI
jgi:hypothetical protein